MKLKLPIRIAGLVALIAAGVTPLTLAGPGSGTATIAPPANVAAGSLGTWSIVYTAAEIHDDGTVRLTVPAGWTAPQDASGSSPGFVTVSTNEPTGNPSLSIAGQVITVAVDTLNAGSTLTIVYGDNSINAAGRATAATTVGSYSFLVASDPDGGSVAPLSSSPAITVIGTTPASLDIVPSDTTNVAAGSFVQMHVRVLDTFGNRAPVGSNRTINLFPEHGNFYDPSNHSTPLTSIVITGGTNSRRVDYRGTIVAGEPYSLVALSSGGAPSLGGSTFISLVPAAMSPSQSTITASSPVIADGADQSTVTVTSRDAFGNPRENDPVVVSATGAATVAGPGGPTGANGEAVAAVANTMAQVVTVSATIGGQAVTSGNPTVTFVAGPVSAANSTVDATTPVIANGIATSIVTVTAKDTNNNPIAGQAVELFVTPSANATLIQPGGVTGPNGQITGTLRSTTVGNRTVTAEISDAPISDNAVVQFTPGPIASFQWAVDGASTAGAFEEVTLRVFDAQGNPATNYTGIVQLSTTSGGVGDGVVQWDAVTPDANGELNNLPGDDATYQFDAADNGVAKLRVTNTRAETFQVRAQDNTVVLLSDNIVNANAGASKIVVVSGNGQSATVNTAVSTAPTVRVLDQFDNTVAGATVTFTAVTGGGSLDANSGGGGSNDSTATTAGNGEIDCDVWRMGTIAGLNRLRARIPSGTIPFVYLSATGTPGAGENLDIAPNTQSVTQGTALVVSATLTDAFGNVKSGEQVTILITDVPADGTLSSNPGDPNPTSGNTTARSGITDVNGRITVLYEAPDGALLSDVLDAFSATVSQSSVIDAAYTTVASGATNLRITFVGSSTREAFETFQFVVEAVDGNGNRDTGNNSTFTLVPEAGSDVSFSLSDFGPTITQAQLQSGVRTVYGRTDRAGQWDITADHAALGDDTELVTITDTGDIASYFVSTVSSIAAGAAFNVTVEARDQYGNRVMGANNSVTLEAYDDVANAPAQATLLAGNANLVSGSVVVAEAYTKAEPIRVRASASGSEGFSEGILTVTAAAAHRIAKVSGDGSGFVAGSNRTIIARVFDPYDNPVANETVNFAVLSVGGSLSATTDVSDANGDASTVLTTAPTVGNNTLKAAIDDESPAGLERVDYLVQTIPGPVASFTVVPASFSLTAGVGVGLTVTGRDANSNVVTNDSATLIQLTQTGSATFGSPAGALTAGVFNTTVTDNVAEPFTITAQRQGGGASGTSAQITVTHAGASSVAKVSLDPTNGIPVGGNVLLTVVVRDQFANPVPTALVTFATTGAIDDGSFTDTSGDTGDGIVATSANGQATVTFTTSLTAGANVVNATILDGPPPAQERVTFTVNTVAGGIAYYTVVMSAYTATAGQPRNVTVSAFDASDNPVDDDATVVSFSGSPGVGLTFGTNPMTLTNGTATTAVTANQVQTYQVRVQSQSNGAIFGLGDPVVVTPGSPAGTITATAAPPTITANGVSTSTITSGVIRDVFSNQVPAGTQINVVTDLGTIVPAGAKLVNANGRVEFDLRSSAAPGLATVNLTSQLGSASGQVNVTFAPPPAFVSNQFPNIRIVAPGAAAAFSVQVQNTSTTNANLTTATTFTFTDGTRIFSANLASPTSIAGPGLQTLLFNSATVDPAFTPGYYAPNLMLVGDDEFNAPISTMTTLPVQSVLVTSIQVTEIQPLLPVVSRDQNTEIVVKVKNNGAQPASITSINLDFTPDGDFVVSPALEVPLNLGPGVEGTFHVPVLVQASCPPDQYDIDASVVGNVSGTPVTDNSVAPFALGSLIVVTAAELSYVPGQMTPMSVSQGDPYQFRATITNSGAGVVSLDSNLTYIRFSDGTRTYESHPVQPYAIAGGAQQQIVFKTRSVPSNFTTGSYVATFNLEGEESGAPFLQTVNSGVDQIVVQTPASILGGVVTPNQVTKSSSVPFTVQVSNSGTASVVLTPASTKFRFAGNQFTADLDANAVTTIPPGGATLVFLSAPVGVSIAPATYPGELVLVGTENGNPFNVTRSTGTVAVQNPPDVQLVAALASQSTITADQAKPFKVRMVVRNNNGSNVIFTSASIRFVNGVNDRTPQYTISAPTSFVGGLTLAGGAIDTVLFDVSDNLGNTMSTGMMTIQGTLNVEEENTGDSIQALNSVGGFVQVQSPGTITVRAVLPSQPKVTQNMTKPFVVRVAVQNTGASIVDLDLSDANSTLTFAPSPRLGFQRPTEPGRRGRSPRGQLDRYRLFRRDAVGQHDGVSRHRCGHSRYRAQ